MNRTRLQAFDELGDALPLFRKVVARILPQELGVTPNPRGGAGAALPPDRVSGAKQIALGEGHACKLVVTGKDMNAPCSGSVF